MTQVELKNGEFVELINGLFSVQGLKGVKFGLLVSKNIRILQNELDYLEAAAKPSEEFVELSVKVNQLISEGSKAEDVQKLEDENVDLVELRRTQMSELEELLDETTKIDLHTIPEDCLPGDISGEQITNIDKIIK
jgi:hypothetical protein